MDVFVEFVGGGFIEDDGVVGLVLDCAVQRRGSVHPGEKDSGMVAKRREGAREGEGKTAYPFLSTTSSFASCQRRRLRVPEYLSNMSRI